ncbi:MULTISPECIES: hypothetical protein [Halomonadaceae]|uniref:hypothetical protein n=1 Tax=Halomonadaceae TaxID=28256 RepID=UPI00159B1571|nr:MULTISPECIES: hypothetical protein [Halomonas]QJQ93948.1 hypothetical protein HIO72_00640 [Halomonas sp. PA5]
MGNAAEKLDTSPQAYASELVELNRVEAAMAELRAKHGTVPDYTSKEGYERGKTSLKELTKYRTGTDKARLAITKPHRDFIEQVNQYAKGLIGEIEQLEGPHRNAKRDVDEAEARKKEERIARLRERIQREIWSFLDTAQGLDSNALADLHEAAERINTGDYFDVTNEAEDARAEVIRKIADIHASTLERERMAAEQAEIETQRRQLREEEERRAAEQAELEELRRFKAEQEAAKAQAEQPAEPVEESPSAAHQPIDTSRLNADAANFKPASQIAQPETVTITKKEYEQLLSDQVKLYALLDAGVDNWTGYDIAMASLKAA